VADSAVAPATTTGPRHTAVVRVTHWLTALCFLALLVTGVEIVISHPRFYWGETGNIHTKALFQIPIPASRRSVPTGYGYVLPDQNGWSRHLHFQAAWGAVLTGLLYFVHGVRTRHFARSLFPQRAGFGRDLAAHLRFRRPGPETAWSYSPVQRLTYLLVIFALFPLMIWTGLAMSPAFVSAVPTAVTAFGGQQSARTIHFFLTIVLFGFLLVHVGMVWLAGFRNRMRAMITSRAASHQDHV
jgi:thiosulfate reductase cytochrome b subunit